VNTYRAADPDAAAQLIAALADDTRRRTFELLVDRAMAVGELAQHLPVSRPAVSQHLKVLREAGLVREERIGTRHLYSVVPQGVAPLREYVDRIWDVALDRYRSAAEAQASTVIGEGHE
jgi:DNA-binding transcriptional ArsR family regulator